MLVVPWRPWSTAESLEASAEHDNDFSHITAIVPARNEQSCISATLNALSRQGHGLRIVLVDDQSEDRTGIMAEECRIANLRIVTGQPPPPGWSGKLWALEQGLQFVDTEFVLLLDADIRLDPGMLTSLSNKLTREKLALVSVMAKLRMQTFWERALLPTFIYFFKLLYPFKLANSPAIWFAAAAGGCILTRFSVLRETGAFATMKHALIDDVTLARQIKRRGHLTWIGLTHSAHSVRAYDFATICDMVARTAFTQLGYSSAMLLACTAIMLTAYLVPVAGLALGIGSDPVSALAASLALATMFTTYLPTLRFYHRSLVWALALPLIATAYLVMTWNSAFRYWRGERSRWKGRTYGRLNQ